MTYHTHMVIFRDTEVGRIAACEVVDRWYYEGCCDIEVWSHLYDMAYGDDPHGKPCTNSIKWIGISIRAGDDR